MNLPVSKKPLYPLVCVASSFIVFLTGLSMAKSPGFVFFLVALCLLYGIFGYGRATLLCAAAALPFGLIVGFLSSLSNGSMTTMYQTAMRIVLLGLCAVLPMTVPTVSLTRSLTQLRCPRILTTGMLITVRFIPILMEESRRIFEAMKTRGTRVSVFNLSCVYRAFILPFIMTLLSVSDILSLSIETRGFDLSIREATVYSPVSFRVRDGVFILAMLSMLGGAVIIL